MVNAQCNLSKNKQTNKKYSYLKSKNIITYIVKSYKLDVNFYG